MLDLMTYEDRSTPAADRAVRQLSIFFGLLTPGDEKALRIGFKLETNPMLEDVTPSADSDAVLMARVRDVLKAGLSAKLG